MYVCQDCGRSHKGGFMFRGCVLENCPACGGVLDNDAPDVMPLELRLHTDTDALLEDWARQEFILPHSGNIPEEEEHDPSFMDEMVLSSCDRWNRDGETLRTLHPYIQPSWKRAWQMRVKNSQTIGWD